MKFKLKSYWSKTFVVLFFCLLSLNALAVFPERGIIATCDLGNFEYGNITAKAYLTAVDIEKTDYPSGGMWILFNLIVPNDLPVSELPSLKDGLKMKGRLLFKDWEKYITSPLVIVPVQKARNDYNTYLHFLTEDTTDWWIESWFTDKMYEPIEKVYYYTNNGKKITFTYVPNKDPMKFYWDYIDFKDKVCEYFGMPDLFDEYSRSPLSGSPRTPR